MECNAKRCTVTTSNRPSKALILKLKKKSLYNRQTSDECGTFTSTPFHSPVNEHKFAKRNFSVVILIHLGNHSFQAQMCLRCTNFLHHNFQFGQIEITIESNIVSEMIANFFWNILVLFWFVDCVENCVEKSQRKPKREKKKEKL